MKKLTKKQRDVLDFIINFRRDHSVSPTYAEMADYFKVRRNAIYCHIQALITKKFLLSPRGRARMLIPTGNFLALC